MKVLLDTNVVSELRKGRRIDPNVRRWFESVGDDDIYLSVLVIGEIRCGIDRIRRRDPGQAVVFERWLERLLQEHGERMVPVDGRVALEWGRLSALKPLSTVDGLLAATALVHGFVLVTRNVRHVASTGAVCLDPFDPRPSGRD